MTDCNTPAREPEPTEFNVIVEGHDHPGRVSRLGLIRVVRDPALSHTRAEQIRTAITQAMSLNEAEVKELHPIIVEARPQADSHSG